MPFVVTIHDLIHLHHRNPLKRAYARAMIGRAVRRSRRVITVSETVKAQIAAEFGHAEKIAVTYNGVDHVTLSEAKGLKRDYFLFVGNEKPHKNLPRLIEAAKSIDVPLVRVGSARFVSREELASLYRGAIALVMPSLEEGFGLPALEAMACGTAVITSEAPALVEITGDAALHVDARSIGAIASAMTRVKDDATLRESLIARGRERAKHFTWRRCADETRAIYISSF